LPRIEARNAARPNKELKLTTLAHTEGSQLNSSVRRIQEVVMKTCSGIQIVLLLLLGSAAATADEVEQNTRVVRGLYDELFSKWNFAVID
jgi:dihydroxyacetone kinase DhaKLM complex PTS-EIIA-like component DhaM